MAPGAGLEPATSKLTASCSTIELPGNVFNIIAQQKWFFKGYFGYSSVFAPSGVGSGLGVPGVRSSVGESIASPLSST